MALKGTITIIKDDTGGGGIIKDDTGGGGATTKPLDGSSPVATAAAPIIRDDTGGGTVTLTFKDERSGKEHTFVQIYFNELCLNVGDTIRYQLVDIRGQKDPIVTAVERITVGTVKSVAADGTRGIIEERDSDKQIAFFQPNLTALRIKKGDFVRYDLVRSQRDKGAEIAVNVREIND